jgi:hypothetical protein
MWDSKGSQDDGDDELSLGLVFSPNEEMLEGHNHNTIDFGQNIHVVLSLLEIQHMR